MRGTLVSLCKPSLSLFLLVGACAAPLAERELTRPAYSVFSSSTVTEGEILAQYGQPVSRGQLLKHDQLIHGLHYFRLSGDWSTRVRFKKHCWFYFAGQKYLGYSFVTGWPEEQVGFDEEKVSQVIKGKTTRDEVIAMFGPPDGMLRYPAMPDQTAAEGDSMVDYGYRLYSPNGGWVESKGLRIVIDPAGVVKDVVFEANKKNQTNGEDSRANGL